MAGTKKIGKCSCCKDPIYEFQDMSISFDDGKKYHSGCLRILRSK